MCGAALLRFGTLRRIALWRRFAKMWLPQNCAYLLLGHAQMRSNESTSKFPFKIQTNFDNANVRKMAPMFAERIMKARLLMEMHARYSFGSGTKNLFCRPRQTLQKKPTSLRSM